MEELLNFNEFESEIVALEKRISELGDQQDLIAFYGSSSFRLWDSLEVDMQPLKVINLGFGGSSFSWCIYYFDRLFKNLRPSHIVIYVGDNDLAKGISPEKVLLKFRKLSTKVRNAYPNIPIDFVTIKPSPERQMLHQQIRLTNNLIRKELLGLDRARLINVFDYMLDENDQAREELYLEDQLHLNEKGYKIWKGVFRKRFGI